MATKIPNAWLCGATQVRIAQGMAPVEALYTAIEAWLEQERLESLHKEEHA